MSLLEAIDKAVQCVQYHREVMTRAELQQFSALADEVYRLAYQAGLVDALPQVPEMRPQLEMAPLPPVQFETKLNLPGDWIGDAVEEPLQSSYSAFVDDELPTVPEQQFHFVAGPRWMHDLEVLRSLAADPKPADPKPKTRAARNKPGPKPKPDKDLAILGQYASEKLDNPDLTIEEFATRRGHSRQWFYDVKKRATTRKPDPN